MHETADVNHARVTSVDPLPVKSLQVAFVESLLVVEERRHSSRCQGHAQDNVSHPASLHLFAFIIDHSDVKSGHGFAC